MTRFHEFLKTGFSESDLISSIKEGLITTYPIKFAVKYLKKHLRYLKLKKFLVDSDGETLFIKVIKTEISLDILKNIIILTKFIASFNKNYKPKKYFS